MKFSSRCEYALIVLLDLSNYYQNGRVHISDISKRRNVPKKYLEQILLQLKKGGFVQSKKGPNGGYALKRHPKKIMVGEVIRLMERSFFTLPLNNSDSSIENGKPVKDGFFGIGEEIEQAVSTVIDNISFAEIQKREEITATQENESYVYYI